MTKKCLIFFGVMAAVFLGITGLVTIRELSSDWKFRMRSQGLEAEDPFYQQYTLNVDSRELGLKMYHCPFSDCLATLNDSVLYVGSKNSLRMPVTAIWSRHLAIGLFPIAVITDGTVAMAKAGWEGLLSLNSKGSEHRENMWLYLGRSKKCLYGLLASPAGLIYPDLVTAHFIHSSPKQIVYPYGKQYSSSALQLFPKSAEDVQKIFVRAKHEKRHISLAGTLMSQGRQSLPPDERDLILNFSHMNGVQVDPQTKTARVGPGATWADIQRAANEHALAVKVMQASNVFSVGGSLSINCHGWDHQSGTLKQTVRSITIVDAHGKKQVLKPSDELFHTIAGGLGAFGAIVEMEIELTENYPLMAQGEVVSPQEYISYFHREIYPNKEIDLHYFRLSLDPKHLFQTGVAVNYIKEGDRGVVSNLIDEPERGYKADRIELQIVRRLDWIKKHAWKLEKRNALIDVSTSRNEAMRPSIKAIFNDSQNDAEWLQEYFVSEKELAPFLEYLGKVLTENDVAVFNASVRFAKQDETTILSYSPHSDMFAVVLFFNQSLKPEEVDKTRRWVGRVIDYLNDHGGAYYLPYHNFATLKQFRESYPNWERALEIKTAVDPDGFFTSGFIEEYLTDIALPGEQNRFLLSSVMDSESDQWDHIRAFIDVIFMQLDSDKFHTLMNSILKEGPKTNGALYQEMLARIDEASPGMFQKLALGLQSLKELQNDLSDQVASLIGNQEINGYVEIGYPGRMVRPLKKKLPMTGPFYVVNDQETLMDYVQSGFPRPYDHFVPLSDYDPIRVDHIPSESVELVTCFIGLHHIPQEKLKPFVRSIARILKPGGHFILMDHDAHSDELKNFASVVHTIFNAGTGVLAEVEKEEVRNFQSLDYWTDIVESTGLKRGGEKPLIREGDPTLNSVVRFSKKRLAIPQEHHRELLATYLTAPEWFNVRSANSYAQFIKHTPFFFFPFFEEIGRFWKIYSNSWNAARQHYSFWDLATSEYNVMNLFVGTTMTIEYTAKGIISMPIRWYYGGEWGEAQRIHLLVRPNGEDLHQVDSRIQFHESNEELVYLDIPRYFPCLEITQKLADRGVDIIDIAGQKLIHVDISVEKDAEVELPAGCRLLYSSEFFDDPDHRQWALEVEVEQLSQVLRFCRSNKLEVVYIHDF